MIFFDVLMSAVVKASVAIDSGENVLHFIARSGMPPFPHKLYISDIVDARNHHDNATPFMVAVACDNSSF